MKTLRGLIACLALLACGQVFAQNTCNPTWCVTGVVMTINGTVQAANASFPVGGSIMITASFQAVIAEAGATLDIEIYNAAGTRVGQSWQPGFTFTAGQIIAANTFSFATSVPGTYTVSLGTFSSTPADPTNLWDGAAQTFVVTPPPYVPPVPPCLPAVRFGSEVDGVIPIQTPAITTRYTNFVAWVCQFPAGYQTYVTLFNPEPTTLTAIWNYIKGMWTLAQAQADCLASCVQPTASESAYQQLLMTTYRPKAVVAFNGTSITRSVYTTNTDGTLNSTPVAGESIAVAASGDETNRIPSAQAYYSVAGQVNASNPTTVLPAGSYTICVVSFPVGSN